MYNETLQWLRSGNSVGQNRPYRNKALLSRARRNGASLGWELVLWVPWQENVKRTEDVSPECMADEKLKKGHL